MEFCGECGTNLMQKCPSCTKSIRWNRKFCPKCGVDIKKEQLKKEQKQIEIKKHEAEAERNRQEKEQKQKAENKRQYLKKEKLLEQVLNIMEFVAIPSGSFMMGNPPGGVFNRGGDERPYHEVHIKSFELLSTVVTQKLWESVMGSNPARDKGVGENYPVYNVSWNDCQEFISKLNAIDPAHTYRLPSESEWEYACRAGTTTKYYWGDSASESVMGRYCWYWNNSNSSTHPVAQKEPNAWGLYDMSGNVWEWCEDKWHTSYSGAPTDGSAWTSGSSSYRVSRGGSWYSYASSCRSADRSYSSPGSSYDALGFRLSRD